MLESFLYSFNSVMPIFLLVLFGMFLKKINFLKEDYCTIADKLVFNFALPFESVRSISGTDFNEIFSKENVGVILYFFVGIIAAFVLLCIIVRYTIKDNPKRSVFVQGAVRGNYAIFALPLAENMFGDSGKVAASALLPVVIVMYNVLAVIGFSIFAPREDVKKSNVALVWNILKSIVKNPLVLGIVISLALSLIRSETGIAIPSFMMGAIGDVAELAVPLSLISIGVNFKPEKLKNGLGLSVWCMLIKNIALPAIALAIGVLLGFRGIPLTMILISFGGPTAVSSYIMAKNMHGDHELASKILLLTTMCSLLTIFMFIFILKNFAFI